MKIKNITIWILLGLLPIANVNADTPQIAALQAYISALQVNSTNADDWASLGSLLENAGELDKAIEAYQKMLTLAQSHQNQKEIAAAYTSLGNIYQKRSLMEMRRNARYKKLRGFESLSIVSASLCCTELDKAIEMFQKSLQANESLGNREGMARNYADLGSLYRIRGEFDKAIELLLKALQIDQALDRKDSMAEDCSALGNVYKAKGNKAEAKRYYQQSIELYNALDNPNAEKVQVWLDELK